MSNPACCNSLTVVSASMCDLKSLLQHFRWSYTYIFGTCGFHFVAGCNLGRRVVFCYGVFSQFPQNQIKSNSSPDMKAPNGKRLSLMQTQKVGASWRTVQSFSAK
jgi:hypothetical protein